MKPSTYIDSGNKKFHFYKKAITVADPGEHKCGTQALSTCNRYAHPLIPLLCLAPYVQADNLWLQLDKHCPFCLRLGGCDH